MKTRTSLFTAIALVAALGSGAFTTIAIADDNNRATGQRHEGGQMQARGPARGGAPFLALTCAPDASERFESRLDQVSDRLDLNDAQAIAFETFQTTALNAQASFSDTCAAFAQVDGADADDNAKPDLIDRMTQRQLMLSAQVEAMDDVLPALESFYNSLTEEQQAELLPHRGDRGDRGDRQGPRGFRAAPEAPAAN